MAGNEQNAVESGSKEGRFKRICVFCGSRFGNRTSFSEAAIDLGKRLVERKIDLVYGGGSVGLMGLISKSVYDGGCKVLGVIPTALLPSEISGETIGEVKRVADMHERKSEMAKNADAFIALPGGYGTMEELLEIIAWSQLGIHDKPVGILNVDGYYNCLLELFDKGVKEGFIEESASHIVISADNAEELISKMEETVGGRREEGGGGKEEEEKKLTKSSNQSMIGSGTGARTWWSRGMVCVGTATAACRRVMHQFVERVAQGHIYLRIGPIVESAFHRHHYTV